ncbi:MAG: hypothetical protein GC153_05450 [Alphaproteobacteria bacterium]|nr:hypothetical protein [Alphaproteobacteria bacterium]
MSEEKNKTRRRIGEAIAGTAPKLAAALGGPLAGAAVEALSKAIFGEAAGQDEAALGDALAAASPETIAAVKKAEAEFQTAIANAAVEQEKIAAGDRASARERQQAMHDWTPSALGAAIIVGFFVVLGAMVAGKLPSGTEAEFSIMLGALATMTAAVVNYFFGSSAGSKEKTKLLAQGGKEAK